MRQLLLPLSTLKRVGPAFAKALNRLIGKDRIFDLLLHRPIRAETILFCPRLFDVKNDELVIIKAKVESHLKPQNPRQPYKVICYTPTGYINLVFFRIFPSQITRMPIGHEIAICGRLEKISGENQIVHPQEILPIEQLEKLPKIDVIYPLSGMITQKFLSQKIKEVLGDLDNKKTEDWIDGNFLKSQNWLGFYEALRTLHNPQAEIDLLPSNPARRRLAYDELLAWQIAVLVAKTNSQNQKKIPIKLRQNQVKLVEDFLHSLPFDLTESQKKAVAEIGAEISSSKKMLRLLQGDVGSGKTIVAISACLQAISQGKQTCVIAPTTVLAKQHFSYFSKFLEAFGFKVSLLTSATTKKQKSKILEELFSGKISILIATHAALEDDVKFQNLGLAVIDEQHRFGVMQRLKLVEKGQAVDLLLMSATPIPRSLMMALYGDMDISVLSEKPKNRQKISTLVMSAQKIDEVYTAMQRAVAKGEKIYWICPRIEELGEEETEEVELVSVKKKFLELAKIFNSKHIALLHGKMKESEKEQVMNDFMKPGGDLRILVSTTVIEVGIDVPDATVILIENSENFGLSQLHQLRGRVGRSDKQSFCILLYGEKLGGNGRKRLNVLRESDDGFLIAEKDLEMRGSGDLLGTKQSGFPEFRIADFGFDTDLLKIAHKNAEVILNRDPKLQEAQSQKYQDLLRLFGYDDCLKMVWSG